jgi:hypothetical protein
LLFFFHFFAYFALTRPCRFSKNKSSHDIAILVDDKTHFSWPCREGPPTCNFFKEKSNTFSFLKKTSATHFPWKNAGNPRRELGRELGGGTGKGTARELEGNWERERELEKHRTSHALKTRKWKNTAFSITPGKGNWTKKAFSITPGKGNWKNTAVASTAGMGTGKAQHVGGPSRHGQLKWVLSSTIMAISCDDLFFEKQ